MIPRSHTTAATIAAAVLLLAVDPALAVKRRAFVTSITGTGNLGSWPEAGGATGLGAGDNICRNRAAAAGLPNANTYRAWLSTDTTDAACHVRGLTGLKGGCVGGPPQAAGPWFLANGVSNFTASLDELIGPPWKIYRPVLMDEFADVLPTTLGQREYWTGTGQSGEHSSLGWNCNGWTNGTSGSEALIGDGLSSSKFWTAAGNLSFCSTPRRLLCLEPGPSEDVTLGWSPGNVVFVTSKSGNGNLSTWPEANGQSGVAAGDQICRTLATSAGLPAPESFVAWLSTSSVGAADRVTANGPFRRVDAYAIANSKADLVDGTIQNSLHVHEDGSYLIDPPFGATTGTLSDGTAGQTCADWTSAASASARTVGFPAGARLPDWTEWSTFGCNTASRLYCVSNRTALFWDGFESAGTDRWSAAVP